jgi:hypothetical protein
MEKIRMKTIILLFIGLLPSVGLSQINPQIWEAKISPETGFESFLKLKEWASKSSFGGGVVQIKLGETNVFYSNRSFASGLEISEVIFFYKSKSGKFFPFLILPKKMTEYQVSEKDNKIIVKSWSEKTNGFVLVLEFGADLIPML